MSADSPADKPRLVKRRRLDPIVTYWRVYSPATEKAAVCVAFEVDGGFELRLQTTDNQVIDSEVFSGGDAREVMDAYASALRQDLLAQGFVDTAHRHDAVN